MARGAIIIGYCLLCLSTVSICTSTQKDVQSAQDGPPYSWTNRRYIVKHIFLNVRVCLPMQKKGKKKRETDGGLVKRKPPELEKSRTKGSTERKI